MVRYFGKEVKVFNELIANAVNDRMFKMVDRQQLGLIRAEQDFQLSGGVGDNLALSIGKFFGAQGKQLFSGMLLCAAVLSSFM